MLVDLLGLVDLGVSVQQDELSVGESLIQVDLVVGGVLLLDSEVFESVVGGRGDEFDLGLGPEVELNGLEVGGLVKDSHIHEPVVSLPFVVLRSLERISEVEFPELVRDCLELFQVGKNDFDLFSWTNIAYLDLHEVMRLLVDLSEGRCISFAESLIVLYFCLSLIFDFSDNYFSIKFGSHFIENLFG